MITDTAPNARLAYNKLTTALGFGIMSTTQMGRAGITWADIHAMSDAGLIRYERSSEPFGEPARCATFYRVLM